MPNLTRDTLADTYERIAPSIVAITLAPDLLDKDCPFPPIIGTGFLVSECVVATNDHVTQLARTLNQKFKLSDDRWPIAVNVSGRLPEGYFHLPLEVCGVFQITGFAVQGHYYGPSFPDVGFIKVKARGLPFAEVMRDAATLRPGMGIATAGYPMGTDLLSTRGSPDQFTPTLQEGIISSVLPFPSEAPHAVMANLMIQGGASGSPVFFVDEPKVIGVLCSRVFEPTLAALGATNFHYQHPTNFSYFVPGRTLGLAMDTFFAGEDVRPESDSKTIRELQASMPIRTRVPQPHKWTAGVETRRD